MTSKSNGTKNVSGAAPRLGLLIAALIFAEFYASLEASMIYTALPAITRDFGDLGDAGWLVGVYVLVLAATAAVGGRLGDLYGRRRVMIIAVIVAGIGSLISAVSHSLLLTILGRALQGACGVILPLALGMVRDAVAQDQRSLWVGVLTGAYSFSGIFGFAIGGALSEYASWRWIFWLTAILAPLVCVIIWLGTPRGIERAKQNLNYWGLLFAPAVACLLLSLTEGGSWGWTSSATLGVLALGTVFLVGWLVSELRSNDPLINIRLLGDRRIAIANCLAFLIGLGAFQLPLVLNLLLQQPVWTGVGLGISASIAGLLKIPSNVASGLAGAFAGYLSGKRGVRLVTSMGAALLILAWGGLLLSHDNVWFVVAAMCVANAGAAVVLTTVSVIVLGAVPSERSSEAVGMTSVSRAIGVTTGALLVTGILTLWASDVPGASAYANKFGYLTCFAFITGTGILAMICGFFLYNTKSGEAEPLSNPA